MRSVSAQRYDMKQSRTGSTKRTILQTVLLAIALVTLLASVTGLRSLPLVEVSNIASIGIVVVLFLVTRIFVQGIWSASAVYLFVYSLFHFGLTIAHGLDLQLPTRTEAYILQWFFTPSTKEAVILSLIGLCSCAFGAHIISLLTTKHTRSSSHKDQQDHVFTYVGFLLVSLSLSGWFLIVVSIGGLGLLTGSYESFLINTAGTSLPLTYYGVGLGLTLLAASPASLVRRIGFLMFVAWALIALPLGLRGEVMFPALAALVVAAKRKIPISPPKALLLLLCFLSIISVVRELRQVGLQNYALSEMRVNPIDALTEMGGSLRPVSEVVAWHEAGDELIYGASYWAPFQRMLYRIVPDLSVSRLGAQDDDRIMNVLVQRRVGPIGFSPVAEAYYNFGSGGVAIVMLLTGLLLGWMDTWSSTRIRQAAIGLILVPLFIQIRNDFVAVPFQIGTGLVILYGTVLAAKTLKSKHSYESHRISGTPLRSDT